MGTHERDFHGCLIDVGRSNLKRTQKCLVLNLVLYKWRKLAELQNCMHSFFFSLFSTVDMM